MKVGASEMGQRKNLCASLGGGLYVACFNTPLHHLSHPTLEAKVDTSAALSELCLNSPFQCCSWKLGFLFLHIPHLYFIFWCKSVSRHSEQTKCRGTLHQGHYKWADPALRARFHFIFPSFSSSLSTEHHFLLTLTSPSLSAVGFLILLCVRRPAVIELEELSAVHS